jgi:hypothetical protein
VGERLKPAVLKTHNLANAQEKGLTLFWAHDIGKMVDGFKPRAAHSNSARGVFCRRQFSTRKAIAL